MAKRFTDTEKWRDEWWGSLSNDYRIVWLYLVDSCSIAGIWKKDFRGLNFNCNTNISEKEFLEVYGSRIIDRGNFFFIPKFVRFQCPKGLGSNKPAVVSIVKELQDNNLIKTVAELFGNDYLIIKGTGKGTDKGNDKGKGKTKETYPSEILVSDEIYNEFLCREAKMHAVDLAKCLDNWDAWYCSKFTGWREKLANGQLSTQDIRKSFESWMRDPKSKELPLKNGKKLTAQEIAGL